MKATQTIKAIEAAVEAKADNSHRRHLGASLIGETCERKLFYVFRWVAREKFGGQMLRLFARGEREEETIADWLRGIGATVWTTDKNGKQFRVSAVSGHFGGSADGVGKGGILEIDPRTPYLCEFKTHNAKSFKSIAEKGLCLSHSRHFAQMQTYMHGLKLTVGAYFAVNKDTDELHIEIVKADSGFAINLIRKAARVINAASPPKKISESAAWFECKFCAFKGVCHKGECVEANCRTCRHASPALGGKWKCALSCPEIADQAGCPQYELSPAFT